MSAPNEYYVDPSVASDGGSGTLASPWTRADGNCIQYAFDQITRNATGGDRINVKAGTPHTGHTATIDPSANWGTPTNEGPWYIQGYTSAAGDGGQGTLLMDSLRTAVSPTNANYWVIQDMRLDACYPWGNGEVSVVGCRFSNIDATLTGIVKVGARSIVMANHFDNVSAGTGSMIRADFSNQKIIGNYFECDTGFSGQAIYSTGTSDVIAANFVHTKNNGATGIRTLSGAVFIFNNAVYAENKVASRGVWIAGGADDHIVAIGNVIEGAYEAMRIGTDSGNRYTVHGNACYDCTFGDIVGGFDTFKHYADSLYRVEALGASPFEDAAGGDFRLTAAAAGSRPYGTANGLSMFDFRGIQPPASGGGGGGLASRLLSSGLIQ